MLRERKKKEGKKRKFSNRCLKRGKENKSRKNSNCRILKE
jgi:hypothetical protein